MVLTLLLIPLASVDGQSSSALRVPQGTATIDGLVDNTEWQSALRIEHPPGTIVRFMRDPTHLYIAVSSDRPGFASVCVAVGDDVHVLHASAALGAITYRRTGDTWQSADTAFSYGMRNTALDDSARAQRASYLNEHGWVGSTVRMSDGRSQEMQIAFSRFAAPFQLAIGRWLFSNNVESWPATLTVTSHEGCIAQRLVHGYVPQELRFHSLNWVTIGR
jgi:hypothetical protein